MRRIDISEFEEEAEILLRAKGPLAIDRDGTTIGLYIPLETEPSEPEVNLTFPPKDRAAGHEAMERLHQTVQEILDRTGMTEDELVAMFTADDDER